MHLRGCWFLEREGNGEDLITGNGVAVLAVIVKMPKRFRSVTFLSIVVVIVVVFQLRRRSCYPR